MYWVTDHMLPYEALHVYCPYTCIVNDLVLPINILREINYRHQTYIIGANINYHQAISRNVSISFNLLIILQAILY